MTTWRTREPALRGRQEGIGAKIKVPRRKETVNRKMLESWSVVTGAAGARVWVSYFQLRFPYFAVTGLRAGRSIQHMAFAIVDAFNEGTKRSQPDTDRSHGRERDGQTRRKV